MRKNYICLWVLFFILFFIVNANAEYNHNKEVEKKIYIFSTPAFISREYLIKPDPDQCLVPLEVIIIGGCERLIGIVPFVTVAEKRLLDMGSIPKNLEVTIEAIICVCENHMGNRLIVVRKLDKKNIQVIYKNPNDHHNIPEGRFFPKNMS